MLKYLAITIAILVALLSGAFYFYYLPYTKFKSDCINQILKRDFHNFIRISFKKSLSEEERAKINELKSRLAKMEDIRSVEYISSDDAMKKYIEKQGIELKNAVGLNLGEINPDIFKSSIEINVGDNETEDYFRSRMNKEIDDLELGKSINDLSISVINKNDYLKRVNFLSFIKMKTSPRVQDLKTA